MDCTEYVPRIWKVIAVMTFLTIMTAYFALSMAVSMSFFAVYIPTLDFHDGRTHTLRDHLSIMIVGPPVMVAGMFAFDKARNHFRTVMSTYAVPWAQRCSIWLCGAELPSPQIDFVYGIRSYLRPSSKPPVVPSPASSPSTSERLPSYGCSRFFFDN